VKRLLLIMLGIIVAASTLPSRGHAIAVNIPAAQDNTLYENATGAVSNGAGDYFFTGRTRDGFKRRAVIRFDIASNIPAGATVTSVTLHLYMSRSKATTLYNTSLYPLTASWGEGTSNADAEEGQGIASTTNDATWIHRFYPATLWTTAGGDYAPQASATTPVGDNGFYSWSSVIMLADVQGWLDTPAQNFGWLIIGDESTARSSKRFDSRTSATTSQRPQLTVEFTPAGGSAGACCLPAGAGCTILSPTDCALQGGTYMGDNTTCTPNPCTGPMTVTLNPVKDNSMWLSSGALSNGAGEFLFVGRTSASGVKRALLQFDIAASLPAGATVTNATLQLEASLTNGGSGNVEAHKVLAAWGEGTSDATGDESTGAAATTNDATWTQRLYPSTAWTTPGGDYSATASATTSVSGAATYQWTSATLISDVQAWLNAPSTNFGWELLGVESGNTQKRFDSRQFVANPAQRPKLIVTYTPPVPTGACCLAAGTCNVMTAAQCTTAGGIYQGDNAPCVTDLCPLSLQPFVDALPLPAPATPVSGSIGGTASYQITIQQVTQKLHRDLPATTVWGYNGLFPGPTIEASVGNPVTVTWINDLRDENGVLRTTHYLPVDQCLHGPDMAGNTPRTVTHLHGAHVAPASDGYPMDTILPGQQQTYTYPNNQVPATLWYHDHAMGITRLNVMMGLAGFYLLRDPAELALNLPSGEFEVPLALQDRSFHNDGTLKYPDMWMDHFFGDVIAVNGKVWPYFNVKQGKYRFRVLDGSNSRVYQLALSNGAPFMVIGTEGGLLPAPVARTEVMVTPGERIDFVIDFAAYAPGTEIILQNSAPAPFPGTPGVGVIPNVMKFIVVGTPGHTNPIPATLATVTPIPEGEAVQHRDLVLAKTSDPCAGSIWLINGKRFDEITEFPKLGSAEVWRFVNSSGMVHPMHMHLTMFQIIDRQNFVMVGDSIVTTGSPIPPDASEAGWKDTAPVYPDQVLRVICRFEDYTGKYPYHCHVLEHEDNEMMRQFEVVVDTTATPVTPVNAKLALRQSYPNPSNPSTRIEFSIPSAAQVQLRLYDVNGRLVATLFDRHAPVGTQTVEWNGLGNDGNTVPSGIYFYRLTVQGQPALTKKLVLLK